MTDTTAITCLFTWSGGLDAANTKIKKKFNTSIQSQDREKDTCWARVIFSMKTLIGSCAMRYFTYALKEILVLRNNRGQFFY